MLVKVENVMTGSSRPPACYLLNISHVTKVYDTSPTRYTIFLDDGTALTVAGDVGEFYTAVLEAQCSSR